MGKYKVGDRVTVNDRGMKTNGFNGEVVGIEPNSKVYNVLIELKDKNDKLTGTTKVTNFLVNQLTKEVKSV